MYTSESDVSKVRRTSLNYVFFFFSSRRRHTRFDCDWSSDVCSSDLEKPQIRCKNGWGCEPARCTRMSPDRHETDARHHSITASAQGAYRAPTRKRGAVERRRGDSPALWAGDSALLML